MASDKTKFGRSIGNLPVTVTEKKRLDVSLCIDGTHYNTEAIAASGCKGLILSRRSKEKDLFFCEHTYTKVRNLGIVRPELLL